MFRSPNSVNPVLSTSVTVVVNRSLNDSALTIGTEHVKPRNVEESTISPMWIETEHVEHAQEEDIHDFDSTGDSSEYDSSDDDSSMYDIEDVVGWAGNNDVATQKSKHDSEKSTGLFLSMDMVQMLRQSTSDGNLASKWIQDESIQTMMPRSSSSGCFNNINNNIKSKIVYAVQTKSPMESPYGHEKEESAPTPYNHLCAILGPELTPPVVSHKDIANQFVTGTVEGYTVELMTAVRTGNMSYIRSLYETTMKREEGGSQTKTNPLQCCNRFQESIVHTVARHGKYELLQYLVEVAHVSIMVRCDTGRTPLHDACWTAGCPHYDMIWYMIQTCPQCLFIKDTKGFTPLEYIPKDAHWGWMDFLNTNANALKELFQQPKKETSNEVDVRSLQYFL